MSCVLLRVVEGVGTAILNTTIFSTLPKLYPKAVGTVVVIMCLLYLRAIIFYCTPQGLFELANGFGYALGPSLGGVMYQVQTQYYA